MKGNAVLTLCFLLSALTVPQTLAGYFTYDNFLLPAREYDWIRFGVYTLEDSPMGNEISTVHLNFTLSTINSDQTGSVYVFLFPSRERYFADMILNHIFEKKKRDHDREKERTCVDLKSDSQIKLYTTQGFQFLQYPIIPHQNVIAYVDQIFEIEESAYWYMYIFHCQEAQSLDFDSGVLINGFTEWKNPYGYLDGKDYPTLLLSGGLSVVYFITIVVWISLCFYYRKDLLGLQKFGTLILVIGLIESVLLFNVHFESNQTGNVNLALSVVLIVFNMIKQTSARVISLLITLGFTITRVSISRGTLIFLIGTCLGYFIAGLSYGIVDVVPDLRTMGPLTTEIIQFPGAMFSLVYFGWLFVSSHNTMNLLREFKELDKVEKYHSFARILGVCLVISTLVSVGKGAGLLLQYDDVWWRAWWMWDAFWAIQFYVVCVAALINWRPLPDNKIYNISPEMLRGQNVSHNVEVPNPSNNEAFDPDQNSSESDSSEQESSQPLDIQIQSDEEGDETSLLNKNSEDDDAVPLKLWNPIKAFKKADDL